MEHVDEQRLVTQESQGPHPRQRRPGRALHREQEQKQPPQADEHVGRRRAPVVDPARQRPGQEGAEADEAEPADEGAAVPHARLGPPEGGPGQRAGQDERGVGEHREAGAGGAVQVGGQGLGQRRGDPRRPDTRRGGDHREGDQRRHPRPAPSAHPLEQDDEELGHRDHLQGVAGEEDLALARRGLVDGLPQREPGQVEEVADAEDEEEAPGPPETGPQRQRRPGQPGHEARGEEEARGGGAVEHQLEDVPGLGPHRRATGGSRRGGPGPSPGP